MGYSSMFTMTIMRRHPHMDTRHGEAYIADSNGSQEVQVTTTKEVNRLDA